MVNAIRLRFTGVTATVVLAGGVTNFPDQTGHAGDVLSTNGTLTSWVTPGAASLPDQTGNSGKYLGTDGTVASWSTVAGVSILADTAWAAAGDLVVGSANDTAVILSKGTALQVLRVNAGATALEWADPTSGGSIATDTIWAAKGDLVQGTGNNTAAVLPIGTAGQTLRVNAGATAVEYGVTITGTGTIAVSTFTLTVAGTASVIGTNTGDQTSVTGNAGTATKLATARAINGVDFDGTQAITVTAAAGTLTGTTLASNVTASSLLSAAGGTFGTSAFITLGTGVGTALAKNVGSSGAPVVFGGDAGTPSALVGTNISGTAASLTAGGNLAFRTITITESGAQPDQDDIVADSTSDTLTLASVDGNIIISSTAASDTLDFSLAEDVTIAGNLTVNGTQIIVNTATVEVEDSLIELAKGNTANSLDIGWYGNYQTAATPLFNGFFWDASTQKFRLFIGLESEPTSTVNTSGTGYAVATFVVNVEGKVNGVTQTTVGGNLLGLTNPGAITFLRVNADNTVDALSASKFATAIGLGATNDVAFNSITAGGVTLTDTGFLNAAGTTFDVVTGDLDLNGRVTAATCKIGGFSLAIAADTSIAASVSPMLALVADGTDVDAIGYRGLPQVSFSAATDIIATHNGKTLLHPSSDANNRTLTIQANGTLALEVGFAFEVINDSANDVTLAITTDTLVQAGSGTTGSVTIPQYGCCFVRKIASTRWYATLVDA